MAVSMCCLTRACPWPLVDLDWAYLNYLCERQMRRIFRCFTCSLYGWLAATCLWLFGLPADHVTAADDDLFELRVRPLLIKHCLDCHGPKKQEGGLRLDSRSGWQRGGSRGPAIVPGEVEKSLLIRAVRYNDPQLQMPPGEKRLSAREIANLEQWVVDGAVDPRQLGDSTSDKLTRAKASEFWSFRPIVRPALPMQKSAEVWSWTPIDLFIKTRLDEQKLVPVQDADKRALIRRATFDLTGLPPTPQEIASFLANDDPAAFSQTVDRLLETKAYGERWGRHWLDVARYADTAGDGADYPVREAVKYRDWVINAFNADQPYDAFLREQIAGDIIAVNGPRTLYASRVTATGFLAIGKRYGYQPSPAFQHLDFADVIDSVGRSLLGLSLGCARCHDHKYDPISAADYYGLYGILQSTTWAFPGGEEQKRPSDFPLLVPPEEAAQLEKQQADILASIDRQLAQLREERIRKDIKWQAGGLDLGMEGQTIGQPLTEPWVCAGPIEVAAEAQSPFAHVHPPGTRGVRLGSGLRTDGIRYVFKEGLKASSVKNMHFNIDFRTAAGADQKGAYRFYLGQGVVASLAIECSITPEEFAIRNGANWEVLRKLEAGKWYTLQIMIDSKEKTYSGVVGALGDLTEFTDKQVAPNWNGIADCFICDATGHVAGPASARDIDNFGLQEAPFPSPGSKGIPPRIETPADRVRVAEIKAALESLMERRKALSSNPQYEVAYGVSEGTPVNARIQLRGNPAKPGNEVPRRFLEVLGGDTIGADSTGSGRLQLAAWLTRDSNPLTARVFVNRVWQWHFGRGIVSTPSDFGSRGAAPSHPDLLDWLAAEFMESGWSVKTLHRRIMRSRTYQLASGDHPGNLVADPTNRWLWRHARRPLDAESIRDAILAVSGTLNRGQPKPHPFPAVNTWGFTIHHPFHAVYDSNHRSVYLMTQRNRRHPYLALFDSADPNLSIGSRQPTTTPTQALYLLNSEFVHAQARGFAMRLLRSNGTTEERVRLAFELGHGRQPPDAEFRAAVEFLSNCAQELAEANQDETEHQLAVWSALTRVILTSNAFLFVD